MGYRSTRACVTDLERHGHLLRVDEELDAHLEVAEIQRRVFASGGPALLFTNVKNGDSPGSFPMASNLFGTMERVRFIFRDTLDSVKRLIDLKVDPANLRKAPLRYAWAGTKAIRMLPRRARRGAVFANRTTIDALPQLISWPDDGGPFVTLPAVYSEDPTNPGLMKSNLGMYRIQLSGNEYRTNEEIGLHYQIHRGIGVHHQAALSAGKPFRVNVFIGGSPAMSVAAVMPLPEGMSELTFAGALAGHRIPMSAAGSELPAYADADFCICGTVDTERLMPEGPFGDHLGYYSLQHLFPVMKIDAVYHRDDAVWPFTAVGRPPQEDTMFGELIHEITGPVVPTVVPGVKAVHAVDAAGVHPLMLAIGSERYVPFDEYHRPREILTQANAILGQGQMSLAKYLMIVASNDQPDLDIEDIPAFLKHLLERIDWQRDLHFQTCTTIDTLDYSGTALNEGSKVVMAAAGPVLRTLPTEVPEFTLPGDFAKPRVCLPGVLAIESPSALADQPTAADTATRFSEVLGPESPINQFPIVTLVDDSDFAAQSLNNWLWLTFTRSNPATDIYGVGSFIEHKHWGCRGSLIIDARRKPHHAPPLIVDPATEQRIDALAAAGGPLAQWL